MKMISLIGYVIKYKLVICTREFYTQRLQMPNKGKMLSSSLYTLYKSNSMVIK